MKKLTKEEVEIRRRKILSYVQAEASKGHYPTYDELAEHFHFNLRFLFPTIIGLYDEAGVPYNRDPNPFTKYEKEQKLASICVKLFVAMGYHIEKISIGPSTMGGPDLIVRDASGHLIPLEIKAYHKFGRLGTSSGFCKYSHYFGNEMKQLVCYMESMGAKNGYLITSTNRNSIKNPDPRVQILCGNNLSELLMSYNLIEELEDLEWIRNTYTSTTKEQKLKEVRDSIITHCKQKFERGRYVPRKQIQNLFGINIKTYFKNMNELYCRICATPNDIPNHRMGGNSNKTHIRERILSYVRSEIAHKRTPTYKEIQKKFHCLPKLYFPGGIREIYRLVGVTYDRTVVSKTPEEKERTRQKILSFIRLNAIKGKRVGWRDINLQLGVGFGNYFRNLKQAYREAGI
ncbi:restriction endonuclease [Candidatus Micrarchaeota archaeon]|nr:restriction endonuclease [Candidatus Micrarchaeota archaeon]